MAHRPLGSSANRAIGKKEDVKSINHYLDTLTTNVYGAKRELMMEGADISTDNLWNILVGNPFGG